MAEKRETAKPSLKVQSAWLLVAKTVGFALSFLLPLLVVRYLDLNQVGIYRESFQVIMTLVAILPFGFSASAYYFLSRNKEEQPAIIFNILIFNFVIGGIACALLWMFPNIIGSIFRDEELVQLSGLIGVVIWLWVFGAFLEIVAVANQEPRLATVFIIMAQFTKTLLMVLAVVVFESVEALIYAAIIQGVIQTIVLLVYLNAKFRGLWSSFSFAIFKRQLLYVLPYGMMALLWVLQSDVHNFFVGYKFTPAEFAIYVYGCFQLPFLGILYESIASVMIPRMSELQQQGDKREMLETSVRAMDKLAFFYFPIYALLLIAGYDLITALFTPEFAAAVPIFLINITLIPFGILISDPVVRAYENLGRFLLKLRLALIPLMIVIMWAAIDHLSLGAMITIVVVVTIIERVVTAIRVMQELEVKRADAFMLGNVAKTAFAALVAGVVTFVFHAYFRPFAPGIMESIGGIFFDAPREHSFSLFTGGLIVGASGCVLMGVYLFIANLLGVITVEEKRSIKNLFNRLSAQKA